MPSPNILRVGPAGWAYPHWDSLVYPRPRPRGFHPLAFLTRYFDVVEINTSFYQPLQPEVTKLWLSRAAQNPRFRFTAKLGRRFTHERVLEQAEVAAHKRGLWPLLKAGKLGCLLMQFPWSFRFTEENKDFFIRLRRAFHEFPLVAEMRHNSWMREEALGVFIDYHVGFCNIDQPQHVRAMPPTAFLTSRIGYVRLHGRNYGSWFQGFEEPAGRRPRNDYLYSPGELEEWRERIEHLRSHAEAVYVTMTNDAGAKSVVNALQLQRILDPARSQAPSALLRAQRIELVGFQAGSPVQPLLFQDAPGAWDSDGRAVA